MLNISEVPAQDREPAGMPTVRAERTNGRHGAGVSGRVSVEGELEGALHDSIPDAEAQGKAPDAEAQGKSQKVEAPNSGLRSASQKALDQLPDEALCLLASGGNAAAEEALVTRYHQFVRQCARPLFLAGGDSEDLIQEGMVGLLKAVREYDGSRDASFHTFAGLCIRTRLSSVLRDSTRNKHKPLNQSISFNAPGFDSNSYASGTTQLSQRNPEDYLIDREYTAALLSGVRKQLSDFEAKILGYYLDGLSCREIAKLSGKSPKSVDNAVQRIRRKVARQILSGEFSER